MTKGAFSSGIRRDSQTTLESEKRAHIDDLAPSKGDHVLTGSLSKDPAHLEVNIDNLQVKSTIRG